MVDNFDDIDQGFNGPFNFLTVPQRPREELNRQSRAIMSYILENPLDAAAIATSPIPLVGDVVGLGADLYDFARDPSLLGAGAMALGALPFVPPGAVGRAANRAYQGVRELPQTARRYVRDTSGRVDIGQNRFNLTPIYGRQNYPQDFVFSELIKQLPKGVSVTQQDLRRVGAGRALREVSDEDFSTVANRLLSEIIEGPSPEALAKMQASTERSAARRAAQSEARLQATNQSLAQANARAEAEKLRYANLTPEQRAAEEARLIAAEEAASQSVQAEQAARQARGPFQYPIPQVGDEFEQAFQARLATLSPAERQRALATRNVTPTPQELIEQRRAALEAQVRNAEISSAARRGVADYPTTLEEAEKYFDEVSGARSFGDVVSNRAYRQASNLAYQDLAEIDAARFAELARSQGLIPETTQASRGSYYVNLQRPTGERVGANIYNPDIDESSTAYQFRFSNHPPTTLENTLLSVDPYSGNTQDEARAILSALLEGRQEVPNIARPTVDRRDIQNILSRIASGETYAQRRSPLRFGEGPLAAAPTNIYEERRAALFEPRFDPATGFNFGDAQ